MLPFAEYFEFKSCILGPWFLHLVWFSPKPNSANELSDFPGEPWILTGRCGFSVRLIDIVVQFARGNVCWHLRRVEFVGKRSDFG